MQSLKGKLTSAKMKYLHSKVGSSKAVYVLAKSIDVIEVPIHVNVVKVQTQPVKTTWEWVSIFSRGSQNDKKGDKRGKY